ncbi:MAG: DUF6465 family protein [Ruminococcus sp.]
MATEKKTAAKTAAKAETKPAAKAETKTAAKAETKTAAKTETKAAPKKTAAKTAAKKPAAKKTETKIDMIIEFAGVQVAVNDIIENVKKVNGKDAKNITIYVKPEESKAYYVADGEEKEMDVYFV